MRNIWPHREIKLNDYWDNNLHPLNYLENVEINNTTQSQGDEIIA